MPLPPVSLDHPQSPTNGPWCANRADAVRGGERVAGRDRGVRWPVGGAGGDSDQPALVGGLCMCGPGLQLARFAGEDAGVDVSSCLKLSPDRQRGRGFCLCAAA